MEVVHALHDSVHVWLLGDESHWRGKITLERHGRAGNAPDGEPHPFELEREKGFMAVETIDRLKPGATYDLKVTFEKRKSWLRRLAERALIPSKEVVDLHRRFSTTRKENTTPPQIWVATRRHDTAKIWVFGDGRHTRAKIWVRPDDQWPGIGKPDHEIALDPVRHFEETEIDRLQRASAYSAYAELAGGGDTFTTFNTANDPEAPRLLLIIGHTTHRSACIWVRGDERHRDVRITLHLRGGGELPPKSPKLLEETDFTATVTFAPLDASKSYDVVAEFKGSSRRSWWRPSKGGTTETLTGELRTFPEPGAAGEEPWSFLHGSCNLSTIGVASMLGLALGGLGWIATNEALRRPTRTWQLGELSWVPHWVRRSAQRLIPRISRLFLVIVGMVTRFEQPERILPSPFKALHGLFDRRGNGLPPAFMIHAGDQIYFDIPMPRRAPEVESYRREYVRSWADDLWLRDLLKRCPQYMTLDDHEIVDGFATDHIPYPPPTRVDGSEYRPGDYLKAAKQAYQDYVHARHPANGDGSLYYNFEYGTTRFFVLDVRTERSYEPPAMIGPEQLAALERWLCQYRDDLKFVVSSVPFLAELRPRSGPRSGTGDGELEAGRIERLDDPFESSDPADKWCGEPFRMQRDRILEYLHGKRIGRLVFLVGDMHLCYHCTTRVGGPRDRITLHEIAGGPFNQLLGAARSRFEDHHRDTTNGGIPFTTWLRAFQDAAIGAILVTVRPGGAGATPTVEWRFEPTYTSFKRSDEESDRHSGRARFRSATRHDRAEPALLSGRITF